MTCHDLDAILDRHAIRSLSPAERARVDAHLAGCSRCAGAWFAQELLLAEPSAAPRAGLLERTLDTIGSESALTRAHQAARMRSPARLAAAAVVAVAVGVSVWTLAWQRPESHLAEGPAASTVRANNRSDDDRLDSVVSPVDDAAAASRMGRAGSLRFVAGRHYERLSPVAGLPAADGRVEVAEFFMWPCFPCYAFEPSFAAWVEVRPDNVDVVRVPVLFNPLARLHAQAFYTAEALGLADTIHTAFFEEIHVRGNPLDSRAAVVEFFARFGVDEATFAAAFDSTPVQSALLDALTLSQRYGVTATPTIVVNGRYRSTPPMAGSYELLIDVLDELVSIERDCIEDSSCPFTDP